MPYSNTATVISPSQEPLEPAVAAPDVLHLGDNDVLRGAYNHDPLPKEYQDAFRLPLLFSKIATPDIPRQGPWAVARVVDGVELQPYQLTAADRRQLREKVGPNSHRPNC